MLGFLKVIAGPLINLLATLVPYLFGKKVGKEEEKRKQAEETLDEVKQAKEVRERLRSDSDYADSVRSKYTRDEE